MTSREASAYTRLIVRLAIPVAGLVAALLALMLACLLFVASYQSDTAWNEQAKLAEGAIVVKTEHVKRRAMDYGAWDEAVERLVVHPDADWADQNVGKTIFLNLDMEMTVVVAPDDSVTYASINGVRTATRLDDILSGGIRELIANQRNGPRNDAVGGLVEAKGVQAVAAVMPIRPLEPDSSLSEPQHLIILIDVMDREMLAEFANVYLLPDLHFLKSGEPSGRSVPLILSNGRKAGELAWAGANPGSDLLRFSVPVWIGVVVGFAGLTAILFGKALTAARKFDDSEHRAKHDALTGLPNRFYLLQAIERFTTSEANRHFTVAYMDLDGFKPVNDQFGHAVGDRVLLIVADRVRGIVPPRAFVARIGGDEFVAIFPHIATAHEARTICQSIIFGVQEPIVIDDRSHRVGVTIGVAISPEDGTDPLVLIRKADQALYAGKRLGKGGVRFHNNDQTPSTSGLCEFESAAGSVSLSTNMSSRDDIV
jgi:diguanylate cyclase (GGDEF)-like protein